MSSGHRVCPQCGNTTTGLTCPLDGWATVPAALVSESRLLAGSTLLGRFTIGAFLEDDGPMAIYGGQAIDTGRPVQIAVMVVPPTASLADIGRMQRAARALETLRHPGIAAVIASGTTDRGDLAVVSEHLEGPTLAEVLRGGELGPEHTLNLGLAMFEALEAAHAAGISHHDLSPDRIRMAPGRVVISDLGFAEVLRTHAATTSGHIVGEGEVPLLARGLPYRAPEQARDRAVTRHADIYAAGAILYEALTGRPMFAEKSAADYLIAHMMKLPPVPTMRAEPIHAGLVSLIMRCVEKKPWNRPESASAARQELDELRQKALAMTSQTMRGGTTGSSRRPLAAAVIEASSLAPAPVEASPPPMQQRAVTQTPSAPPVSIATRDAGRPRAEGARPSVMESIVARLPRPLRRKGAPGWVWTLASVALLAFGVYGMLRLVSEHQGSSEAPAARVAIETQPPKPSAGLVPKAAEGAGAADVTKVAAVTKGAGAAADESAPATPGGAAVGGADPVAPAVVGPVKAPEASEAARAVEPEKNAPKSAASSRQLARQAAVVVAEMEAERTRATWKALALVKKERSEAERLAARELAEAKAAALTKERAEAKALSEAKARAQALAKAELDAQRQADDEARLAAEDEAQRKAELEKKALIAKLTARTKPGDRPARTDAPPKRDPPVEPVAPVGPAANDTPPNAPQPGLNRALLSTVPTGAAVLMDGRLVGRTPMTVSWPTAESVSVWVTLAGHEPANLELSERQNGKMLRLELIAAQPAAKSP